MNVAKKLTCKVPNQTMKKYKLRQREFERKLKFNTNSDSLDLWYKHIVWICDNSELVEDFEKVITHLIENCIETFVQNKKYTNDERFFDIFLKYTRLVCDPLEIYESLNSIQLFEKIAEFYINWAWLLENSLKYNKSIEILDLGITRKAKPIQSLIEAKSNLENKIKNITFSLDKVQDEEKKSNKLTLKFNSNKKALETNNKFNEIRKLEDENLKKSPRKEFIKALVEDKNNFFTPNKNSKFESVNNKDKIEVFLNKFTPTPFKILEDKTDLNEDDIVKVESNLQKNINTNEKKKKTIKNDKKISRLENETKIFKEPKLVIFEVLKPNQKFYADLKSIYVDQKEYSFEELRSKKFFNEEKKKLDNTDEKEKFFLKEIQELKNQLIKAEEEKKKENDNLQKQLDFYKQKLDFLLSTINLTQNDKRYLDEVDFNESKQNCKKMKKNLDDIHKTKPIEKEYTIVREMWNGTLENNSNCGDYKNQREFTIYKDPSQTVQNFKNVDFSIHPQFNLTLGDLNTMQLPSDTLEFTAKMSSTPFVPRKKKL